MKCTHFHPFRRLTKAQTALVLCSLPKQRESRSCYTCYAHTQEICGYLSAEIFTLQAHAYNFVSFWQYFPHSSDCFPHSFSSQEFGKTSLWNKYHSLLCDFWKFVGKTHHSCKFLGHSRPNGLSWPKNLHSLWVFSSLIFLRSRSREMIISSWKIFPSNFQCNAFFSLFY